VNDQDLLRYSRQIMLPQIGSEGQDKLLGSTMLLIGMGGLGSPSAMYLAAAGVGSLIIVDFDDVEISNLQRQIVHHTQDIGKPKVESAKDKMHSINPDINITTINEKLDDDRLNELISSVDIVLDGTDNFDSRFAINKACVRQKTPLVSAAVIRFEGQMSVFKGYENDKPCYQCLYSKEGHNDNNCVENGILAPVAGVMGSLQALQAIKTLLNIGEQLESKLMLIDALDLTFRTININKDDSCPVCSNK